MLTPSRELSALYARGLIDSEVPRARQVVQQDFTFAPGVEVTEIEQVKGLEFDYVILVEVSSTHFPDRPRRAAPAARRRDARRAPALADERRRRRRRSCAPRSRSNGAGPPSVTRTLVLAASIAVAAP